jgi:hypothetical protein
MIKNNSKKMNASEALFGFAAWLSTRDKVTKLGAKEECGCLAEMVTEFIRVNSLPEVRERWTDNLEFPKT